MNHMKNRQKTAMTGLTRRRYDRNARFYDSVEYLIERLMFRRWRRRIWALAPQGHGLEVGVGTGKNIPYHPSRVRVTGIDLSPQMLQRARLRMVQSKANEDLREMDVERLNFPDDAFDWAVGTFVFCSVPDSVQGLQEIKRVVRPGGFVYLLEHVRIDSPFIGRLMDLLNPLAVRLTGANINRRTAQNVAAAGLTIETVTDLAPLGLVKLIVARSP